jgi:hypothetical protein
MRSFTMALLLSILTALMTFGRAAKPSKEVDVHFLPAPQAPKPDDKTGKQTHISQQGIHAPIPLHHLMKMLPLDIPSGAHIKVIHLGPRPISNDPLGDILGDPMINAILSELSSGFHDEAKPLMKGVHSTLRNKPHPCIPDISKFCMSDEGHKHQHFSELHCLGQHAKEISAECADEVQKSIPFVCSLEISLLCSSGKTINKSVLQCLEDELERGSDIDTECRHSIGATRSVLNKMKTQSVTLVDRRTGEVISSPSGLVSRTIHIGVYLACFSFMAILLYAVWVRDDETSVMKSIQRTLREIRLFGTKDRNPARVSTMELKDGRNDNGFRRAL